MDGRADTDDNKKNAEYMLAEIKSELIKGMRAHISMQPNREDKIREKWLAVIRMVEDHVFLAMGDNNTTKGIGYGNAFKQVIDKLEETYGGDKIKKLLSSETPAVVMLNDKKNINDHHYKRMIGLLLNDIYTQIKTHKCVMPGDENQKDRKFEPARKDLDKIVIPYAYHDACKEMKFMAANTPQQAKPDTPLYPKKQ